ncbi:MAG: acyl-CoA N-acyltransferase [Nitrospirae bacterium]|nr:acyl-CoA N-acyltransferase [Nitrospirota bacterium]
MAEVEIITVEGGSELEDFIDLPWKIYSEYPNWVPPIKKDVRLLLDPLRHPFWEFSERTLFLARRGPETVGRIAGIVDRNYNQCHNEKMGIWGFFECADDREAASALFSAVEEWGRRKGMTFMRGPLSPSMNYETGLLIEGFDYPPAVGMTYNPPYYLRLIESRGLTKEKDLLAFLLDGEYRLPDWMERLAQRTAQKKGVRIRHVDKKKMDAEYDLIREIYNDSWSGNWGFVPLTVNEMRDIQKSVTPFADPGLVFFMYYNDEPAAVCVIFPDVNPLLKCLNGRISPLGLIKAFICWRKIRGLRLLMFGIREKFRQLGLPMLAFHHIYEIARVQKKYQNLEMGWTLEDNEAINGLIEETGARRYKKYRIFRKSL